MRNVSLFAFSALLAIAGQASAVTVSSFTGGDVGEGLDLDGSFQYAINVSPQNTNNGLVIRDARFKSDGQLTTGAILVAPNVVNEGGWGNPDFGASTNDNNLEKVARGIRWNAAPGDVTVDLPNLTIGETYKLQLLFREACCNRGFDVEAEGATLVAGFSPVATQGGTAANAGAVVEHTFVATDKVLNIVLDQSIPAFGDNNPILNGLTLEHVSAAGAVAVTNVVNGTFSGAGQNDGLDLVGNFTHAVNVGGGAATVGDVNFADGSPGNNPDNAVVGAFNVIGNWANPNFGATADDDGLEVVMQSIRWAANNQDGGQVTVDLGDLDAGDSYKVQLLFAEACCNNRGIDVLVDGNLIQSAFFTGPAQGGATANLTMASFISFEFEATDSLVNIVLDGFAQAGDQNPILSGFTVENITVPEPATATLALFGIAGLLKRRRIAA